MPIKAYIPAPRITPIPANVTSNKPSSFFSFSATINFNFIWYLKLFNLHFNKVYIVNKFKIMRGEEFGFT